MKSLKSVKAKDFRYTDLIHLSPLSDWFFEAYFEDGVGLDEPGFWWAPVSEGFIVLFFGLYALSLLYPGPDDGVPGVGVVAGGLFGLRGFDNGFVDDPPESADWPACGRAVAEAGVGFGPKLVAIAREGIGVDFKACHRPPAAAAGFVLEIGFFVGGGREYALAWDVDTALSVGGPVVVYAAWNE